MLHHKDHPLYDSQRSQISSFDFETFGNGMLLNCQQSTKIMSCLDGAQALLARAAFAESKKQIRSDSLFSDVWSTRLGNHGDTQKKLMLAYGIKSKPS